MTNLQEDLQARIAEAARQYVGSEWTQKCGDFGRKVLAEQGIEVTGRLRDFGRLVIPSERKPGDIIFLYALGLTPQNNQPREANILTGPNSFVGSYAGTVREKEFEVSDQVAPNATTLMLSNYCAIIRNVS